MHTIRTLLTGRGSAALVLRAALVAGCCLLVSGCLTDQPQIAGVPTVPPDVRLRHPITVTEAEHSLQLFIGANRSALTAAQRSEVRAFAGTWRAEATGGVLIDLPTGTANQAAAAGAVREIQSILAASGVPPRSMMVRGYPANALSFATIHITYPRVAAQAGPCGLWPQDIGIASGLEHWENQSDWNFGCGTQRNLAAMIDNPADLVQPRNDTVPDSMKRTDVMQKYEKGQLTGSPRSPYFVKITDFGQ